MTHPIKDRIINELDSLNQDQQKKLLDYVLTLKVSKKVTSGKDLAEYSGIISKEDLAVMEKGIEKDCEQVDFNEW